MVVVVVKIDVCLADCEPGRKIYVMKRKEQKKGIMSMQSVIYLHIDKVNLTNL